MSDQNYDNDPEVAPDELTEEQLNDVSGGFNPQPDPPGKTRLSGTPLIQPQIGPETLNG